MAKQERLGRRVAIVRGMRTPFSKMGTDLAAFNSLDLARMAVQELVERAELDPKEIDSVVFGQVIPTKIAPSIAREVVIAAGLPLKVEAHTATRACATSVQTLVNAANQIALGDGDVAIAGGTESMSDAPLFATQALAQALIASTKGKNLAQKLKPFTTLKAHELLPTPPAIAEYSTGLTMGQSAEKMAKENGITREAQDVIAERSHHRAAAAWAEGRYDEQVLRIPIPPKYEKIAKTDNIVRKDTNLEALSKLKPVFDKQYGTVTAGNASPLTDGAAALLVMSEEKAKALGYEVLGYLRSYAFAATDPAGQLLQGPAYAAPLALDRAGMKLSDIDLVEMHEAFAAQVASNLQAFASKSFAESIGRSEALGEVDPERLNVNGGSISIGHPFGATGARIVMHGLAELGRRNLNTLMCSVCAAGGLGGVLILERE